MKHKSNITKSLLFSLTLVILISTINTELILGNNVTLKEYQYIYDYNGDAIFTIDVTCEGDIYFYGKHSKSASTYIYHTTGFTMTLSDTGKNPLRVSNRVRIQRLDDDGKVVIPEEFYSSEYTIDAYRLDSQEVTTKLVQLLKNQGYSSQKAYKKIANGVDVYFSNIFEVLKRDSLNNDLKRVGTKEYYSYDGIINAIYDLVGVQWSSTTQTLLKYYYDNKIHIRLSPFFYDVVYVDAADYAKKGTKAKIIDTGAEKQEIFFGQYTEYELPSNQKLTINKKQYTVKSVEYVYDTGQANVVYKPTISNGVISAYHGIKDNSTLYVLLEPNPITVTPAVSPATPTVAITPVPSTAPTSTEDSISYLSPKTTGIINVQPTPNTGYDARIGVPTTEKLFGCIQTSEYLINIVYEKTTGQITYPITVQKTYNIKTKNVDSSDSNFNQTKTSQEVSGKAPPEASGKASLEKSDADTYTITAQTVTQSGSVTRSYSYTEIVSIDYYKIKSGTLTNQTLPGGTLTLNPQNYKVPDLNYHHFSSQSEHLRTPSGIGGTIVLSSEEVTALPNEDLITIGSQGVGQIYTRSDSLTFGKNTVLSSDWKSSQGDTFHQNLISAPQKINQSILYEDQKLIEKTLKNKTYPSSGTITYEKVVKFNSNMSDLLTFSIDSVNEVKIHTPVYCKPVVKHDNNPYLQLFDPDKSSIPLILDENSVTGDFTLQILNEGYHSNKAGYGNKNYAKYLASKDGTMQNEVKFPVEMYQDVGNDYKQTNDVLLPANTWSCIGASEQRYYIPMWVAEGIYTVDVRSVAVNGSDQLSDTEETKNASVNKYVATDSFTIQTSGRLYGFTLYDIQNYPMWQEVFRAKDGLSLKANQAYTNQLFSNTLDLSVLSDGVKNKGFKAASVYDYTIGTNDSYGIPGPRLSNYTMPLLVGAHPRYSNQGLIKTGYTMRFRINTNGDVMAQRDSKISITPRFYYVDSNGSNRTEVDLYYQGTVGGKKYSLIQVGSSVDKSNKKSVVVGDPMLAIPQEELLVNATIQGMKKAKFNALSTDQYSFDQLLIGYPLRMYSNLAFAKVNESDQHTEEELQKLKQTYYFTYSLPDKVKAVKKGYDVANYAKQKGINFKEEFWLKDGYLIVNFDITALDMEGNIRYSYINKENYIENDFCSMWLLEGGAKKKTDSNGLSIQFLAGDALIFSTNETASDDYSSDGIY